MSTRRLKPWDALTKAGQTRRLRELAGAALDAWGLVGRLSKLSDSFNTIFRLDAAGGQRLVVRVHRPDYRSPAAIGAELAWLRAIAGADAGVVVPAPLPARDGALVCRGAHVGVPGGRLVSVLSWLPGRPIANRATPAWLRLVGQAAARLHSQAAEMPAGIATGLPLADRLFFDEVSVLDAAPRVPQRAARALLARAVERCEARFELSRVGADALHACHCDLHLWNVHTRGRRAVGVLDFDDACLTWPAYDLGIARFYLAAKWDGAELDALWRAFREGYEREIAWPTSSEAIHDFVIARQLELLNTVLASRDRDLRALAPTYLERACGRLRGWLRAG